MKLESYDLAILRALDLDGGFAVRHIADRSAAFDCGRSWPGAKRSQSGAIVGRLKKMEAAGLVKKMDDLKPIAWVLTTRGLIARNA